MTTAQDEFDALVRSSRPSHPSHHPSSLSRSSSPHPSPSPSSSTESLTLHPSSSDASTSLSHLTLNASAKYYIPPLRSQANTGPKGVIADAQAYEDARRRGRQQRGAQQQQQQQAQQKPRVVSYSSWKSYPRARDDDDAGSDGDGYAHAAGKGYGEEREEGEEGEAEDEEFMHKWRQSRLKQLQVLGWDPSASRLGGGGRKAYGSLEAVDARRYLDAVENSQEGTVVVVFISDDGTEISDLVEDSLRVLARRHRNTRFVKFHYEEAEMEGAGVPALLAYRDGDKFAGLVPLVDEMPEDADLGPQALEAVLVRHQILFE